MVCVVGRQRFITSIIIFSQLGQVRCSCRGTNAKLSLLLHCSFGIHCDSRVLKPCDLFEERVLGEDPLQASLLKELYNNIYSQNR